MEPFVIYGLFAIRLLATIMSATNGQLQRPRVNKHEFAVASLRQI